VIESSKCEAVLSNVTVTEARKEKFDFATYRNDLLGFYAKSDSDIAEIKEANDVAGKRDLLGSGTNREAILVRWTRRTRRTAGSRSRSSMTTTRPDPDRHRRQTGSRPGVDPGFRPAVGGQARMRRLGCKVRPWRVWQ
jgi:Bacterial extracellular solute-binding proteins, family 3